MHTLDSPPNDIKYRCHWTAPLAIDPFDHNTVYYGCQVIFKTTNGGQSWSVISPDLSTQDPAHIVPSGGIVGDNLGQFYGEVVFAIAPSKIQKGLIWAGTNDGQVWNTQDGAHWTNVTKNIPGLPPLGTITSIAPSTFDARTAYVSVDFHLSRQPRSLHLQDHRPGQKLEADQRQLAQDIRCPMCAPSPKIPTALACCLPERATACTTRSTMAATGPLSTPDFRTAPVTWAVVQKDFHDLVVSTYGRGLYILDDISPLEQMAKNHSDAAVTLFEPTAELPLHSRRASHAHLPREDSTQGAS